MSPSSLKSEFTIRSANQTLPLVKMIVQDIVQYSNEIVETRERLLYLNEGRDFEEPQDDYGKELQSIEQVMTAKSNRVQSCIEELNQLNLVTTNVVDGFVDFPATRENEPIYLCWFLRDREVLYWHRTDEDCSQRQPIDLALIRQSAKIADDIDGSH
ncbi:MAG: DUF2203 family protein [Planctomycetota bacterium]